MTQLIKKIKINTTIELLTGLHIGGSADSVEIGGIDNPVIKLASKANEPYIPGSSLKGKMRSLLEQAAGCAKVAGGPMDSLKEFERPIVALFGSSEAKYPSPSRIIVRDAMLTRQSAKQLVDARMDMPFTENKYENTIERVKGTAEHPRQTERVPAGAVFNVEFVLNVFDGDNEEQLLETLKQGIALLENDYLGGSGSRGYGQVKFGKLERVELSAENEWGRNR